MNKKLTFRLLGNVIIELDGQPLRGLPSRAAKALLIYLVCHDRPIPRETLADLLWYERSQKQGLTNLRTILTGLRRELKDHLTITRQTLAFNHAADYWLDVACFENQLTQLLPELQTGPPLPVETATRLQSALDLYRGHFLGDFSLREGRGFETWVLFQQEQLQRLAVSGLRHLVEHDAASGNYQQGIANAEKLLAFDPYNETALRQLMWLLIHSGQPVAAIQRYQKFSQLLAEEVGLEPAPETTRLYQRIRAARTIRVDNLPKQPSPFVGRENEQRQLNEYLANPHCRLVTLVGPGGIGKTQLAIKAARRQQSILLHGVCFIPLAALTSADLLISAIAGGLKLSMDGVAAPKAQLLKALQEREILLLLDNFEHLLSPSKPDSRSGAGLLSEILAAAPEVKLLVTSRERLNLEAEWLFQVEGLPAPDETEIENAAEYSAVQLFLQNAIRVHNRFTATETDLAAIGHICRLVEGMPLGIKLAAAWVQTISCPQIVTEIEHDLAFLQSSTRDALPRHRSIEVVFDHSWQLLSPEERQIMGQLSVFRAGFKPEAARQVTGATLPLLASLVNKSWLALTLDGRYEIHELVRRYAADKLEQDNAGQMAGGTSSVRTKHAKYYMNWLKEQQGVLESLKQIEGLMAVTEELENVRAAWQWAVDQNRLDFISGSLESIWTFYEIKSWFHEGEEVFERAVDALNCNQPTAQSGAGAAYRLLFTQLLIRQGWFCLRLAWFDQARRLLEQGLQLARDNDGYGLEIGRALHHLALIADLTGQYVEAKQLFEESLAAFRQNGGSHFELGNALGSLGHVLLKMEQFDQAKPVIEEGIFHYQATNNPRAIALMYSFLGGFSIQQGNYSEAKPLLQQGLVFQEKIEDLVMIRMSLTWLGEAYEGLGDYHQAQEQYERSLLISRGNGDSMGMITASNHLGRVCLAVGEYSQARLYLRDALSMAAEIQFMPLLIDALGSVAALLAKTGNMARALPILSLILDHPAADPQIKKRIAQLQAELEAACSTTAATQTESGLTLETIVAELLAADTWKGQT